MTVLVSAILRTLKISPVRETAPGRARRYLMRLNVEKGPATKADVKGSYPGTVSPSVRTSRIEAVE
jgi:hypothetical protein